MEKQSINKCEFCSQALNNKVWIEVGWAFCPWCGTELFKEGTCWIYDNAEEVLPEHAEIICENFNSLQLLKSEISAMLSKWKHYCELGVDWYEIESSDYERLKNLLSGQ